MKILIIRFSSIGDVILTTPVVRCLKKQLPGVEVHYVTKIANKSFLETNPYIDKLIFLEEDLSTVAEDLKKENYDLVIDLHKNLRTLRLKLKLGVKSISFDKLNWRKWLLVNFKKFSAMPNIHIVDRYMATVSSLGVVNDLQGLDYFIPEAAKVDVRPYQLHEHEYVLYAIGGQHFTKKMPAHLIAKHMHRLSLPLVLIGGKEDKEVGTQIKNILATSSPNMKVVDFCGELSLNQSASLVQQAKFVISHDTGMMHVAAALKKKTFAIWGNTVPELGMYPYLTEHYNLQVQNLSCRPCSKIGYQRCPEGHFDCMTKQDLSIIFAT
jgi:ADP-heptose:LPS heptosyltransferase